MGTHLKCLTEALQMNSHNICFHGEIRKIFSLDTFLPVKPFISAMPWEKLFSMHTLAVNAETNVYMYTFWQGNSLSAYWNIRYRRIRTKRGQGPFDWQYWSCLIWICTFQLVHLYIAPEKTGYPLKINIFLISPWKHMLWVLIGSTSARHLKWEPTTYVFVEK